MNVDMRRMLFINNEDQNQFKNMGKDIPSKYHLGTSPKVIMALEKQLYII
jgi:hypothetical protein